MTHRGLPDSQNHMIERLLTVHGQAYISEPRGMGEVIFVPFNGEQVSGQAKLGELDWDHAILVTRAGLPVRASNEHKARLQEEICARPDA